jgi:threonylcarbamoyladenosine tRNA methylthiotransferase MtaB
VKIQDGCDAFCSYCIVCYTRPRVRSRTPEDILDECRTLVAAGHREIVLCGVFLGAFGRSTAIRRKWTQPSDALADLLERVANIPGLWRVRLSSLEPGDVTPRLLGAFAENPTVAPHLHLPLQSGSGPILHRMNRQYTPEQFLDAVRLVRRELDRPAITTDIIAGFPGEMHEDFLATLEVAQQAGFSKIHAFPFSAIEGTAAWTFRQDAPPKSIVRQRLGKLAQIEAQLAHAYRQQFVGEQLQALLESTVTDEGLRIAMTDRYLPAAFADENAQPGEVVKLKITGVTPTGLAADRLG